MKPGPGRSSFGTGLSPTVYGRRMNKPSCTRSSRLFRRRAAGDRGASHIPPKPLPVMPRALMLSLLLSSFLPAPDSLYGQDDQAYEVLEAASERYLGLESLCYHFDQVIEVTLLRRTVSSEGTICHEQPDLFSMRFSDPEGDLVIIDGEFLWIFYPSNDDEQVMRSSAGGGGGGFNFYNNILEDPRGRFTAVYEGREPMGEGTSHKITLTPKGPSGVQSVGFRTAVIWSDVDNLLITAVEIHDTNESIKRLRFSDIRMDIEIPDEVFRFVPPEGARVMTDPRARR